MPDISLSSAATLEHWSWQVGVILSIWGALHCRPCSSQPRRPAPSGPAARLELVSSPLEAEIRASLLRTAAEQVCMMTGFAQCERLWRAVRPMCASHTSVPLQGSHGTAS